MTHNSHSPLRNPALLLITAALLPGQLHPQERVMRPEFGAVASTLGVGLEFGLAGDALGLRAGYYRLSFDRTEEIDGVRYHGGPDLENARALLDVYPFGGAFRLTGGAIWSQSSADAEATLTAPLEIGGRTYQPAEVGEVRAHARYGRDLAPYLGLGFGTRGQVGFTFELGVAFTGRPSVTLTGQTNLTGPEKDEFDRNIALEEEEIRRTIDDEPLLRYYPVVALGLKLRF